MNEVVFALALHTGEKFVVVDGPFSTYSEAVDYKHPLQQVLKLSKENFEKAMQW